MKKRTGLGRGLSALLSDNPKSENEDSKSTLIPVSRNSGIDLIDLNFIETNPYQPRTYFDQEALK